MKVEMEEERPDKNSRVNVKETRVRLRCGSTEKAKSKGFKGTKCSLCGKGDKTIAHISERVEMNRKR